MGGHKLRRSKEPSMLVAQITDVHIGFDPGNPDEYNRQRLDMVVARLQAGPNQPDIVIVSGDLTDKGDLESYYRYRDIVAEMPWPTLPAMGNHDLRDNFREVFPGYADENGFIQYEHRAGPLRLVVIDTLEEGRHGGGFCDARAAWLAARMAEQRDVPTYIVMHHPPVESGIEWMTTAPDEPWVERFAAAIADAPQVKGVICGHLHRSLTMQWNGLTVAVCSSVAPQVSLDLRPIDIDIPDNRPMIVAEDPAFALHHWNGEALVSFFDRAGRTDVLASYDARMQPLVSELIGERPV
jgi:Icc protein